MQQMLTKSCPHLANLYLPKISRQTEVLLSLIILVRIQIFLFSFQKTEEWEKNKTEADMEEYIWKNSSSEKRTLETLLQINAAENKMQVNKEELLGTKEVEDYQKSLTSLKNEGENEITLSQYKESVKRLLKISQEL